ncbi:Rad2 nuclease [Terramyces sp. JEL0728]|nr:Rad2 nuclease [Terramyces sp. JEL0728]
MGIQGLLPLLKEIQKPINLESLKHQSVGIDGYVWLHKGAFGCALELHTGVPTKKYVDYCMKKIDLLLSLEIWPVVVFDGGYLPLKEKTEIARRTSRTSKRERGLQLLKDGKKEAAREVFQTCIDVTPEMALEWILELRKRNIEYYVAPYEADAQLAYLNKTGVISAVITEDSDLLLFGCQRVIYKLDHQGNGLEINLSDLSQIKALRYLPHERFVQMCILSGCDYLNSPPGIGLGKATKLLKNENAIDLIGKWDKWKTVIDAPKLELGYLEKFKKAEMVFKHQRVYCPNAKALRPLNDFPEGFELSDEISEYIGPDLPAYDAQMIAEGNMCPISRENFVLKPLDSKKENIGRKRLSLNEPFKVSKHFGKGVQILSNRTNSSNSNTDSSVPSKEVALESKYRSKVYSLKQAVPKPAVPKVQSKYVVSPYFPKKKVKLG